MKAINNSNANYSLEFLLCRHDWQILYKSNESNNKNLKPSNCHCSSNFPPHLGCAGVCSTNTWSSEAPWGLQKLKSACVMGGESEHFHLEPNSPIRQQNAFFSASNSISFKIVSVCAADAQPSVGMAREVSSAALSKQLPSKSHHDSHTSPHVSHSYSSAPLLPSKIRGRQFTLSAITENSQPVVFKYSESAPVPSPKSGGWLKKSHRLKNIKSVGIFFLICFLIVILRWFKRTPFPPTSSPPCSPQNQRRDSHILTRFRASEKTLHNTSQVQTMRGVTMGREGSPSMVLEQTLIEIGSQKIQFKNWFFFCSSPPQCSAEEYLSLNI